MLVLIYLLSAHSKTIFFNTAYKPPSPPSFMSPPKTLMAYELV